MALEFKLPQFGMGMTDGTITCWYKAEGDTIVVGETLFEVEAAKMTVEVPSPVAGTLARIVVPTDRNVPVQTVVAVIETEMAVVPEHAPNAPLPEPEVAAAGRRGASPLARRVAALNGVDIAGVQGSGAKGRVRRSDVEATLASARSGRWDAGLEIEPRARRAARELDIDLRRIAAGKPGQRIVEADVRAFAIPAPAPHPCEVEVPAIPVTEGYTEQRHSAMRRVIAARLTESKQTVPHFYLVAHCEIDRLLDARVRVNGAFPEARVSVNDFVILAMARALELVPDANVGWTETAMRHYAAVDIAMAVATDGGLITPIIRRASTKSLRVIAAETKDLAARARAGRLASQDYEGGSASVSNLGMFGTEEFCAIINPPQACILAVGAGGERPVARDGALAVATVMTCTLSVDHRAIDGAVAARLLAAFKEMIENPAALLS